MEAFTTHTGIIATLNRSNVDTDQIIPKQFLKSILRVGYGPSAFFDWRYDADGQPVPDFELNAPRFEGRSILVARNNFGCGSSREHAVWALLQDGYRVVIAPWKSMNGERVPAFADIFRSNSVKNGLLTIELTEEEVDRIFTLVDQVNGLQATVDLGAQRITLHAPEEVVFGFEIDGASRERLIKGLDDIDISLTYEADITRFEKTHESYLAS
ncbi:MAG: 3-isopropylmalate dehydratase small subunit [Desulfobacteraceae bacterium]|jgi:3-isopropylmalate/(R)-2-methylmalate dehydratase small subunit